MAGDCIRLTAVERVKIELGLRDGLSLTAIAAELGRPKGTMSKENFDCTIIVELNGSLTIIRTCTYNGTK
jgi:hypothetical protein